jgi:uroporphyrinogen III methyltransferase/synthase
VRFLDPEEPRDIDRAIALLGEFDWLVFTSANAVRFFAKRCRSLGRSLERSLGRSLGRRPSAEGPRIAAVGSATRAAVEAEQLQVALVPREFSGMALAAELAAEVAGKSVLLPRSDRAANDLPGALRAAGAKVTEVVAYRTAETENIDPVALAVLLRGEADAVTFFSPSAFHCFARALGDSALHEIGARLAFAAVGPVTAAAIRGAGLVVAVEAPEATSASLAAALERHFARRPARKERA